MKINDAKMNKRVLKTSVMVSCLVLFPDLLGMSFRQLLMVVMGVMHEAGSA